MHEERVDSWEKLESRVLEIKGKFAEAILPVLFRGQRSSRWDLETTLEREGQVSGVREYYQRIRSIRPQIETFTNQRFEKETDTSELVGLLSRYDKFSRELSLGLLRDYSYFLYLRHHGFPSPLLDWTRSLYVAAYFAFAEARPDEEVAIFVFCDQPQNMKSWSSGEPSIHRLGSVVQTHKRHFLQQAEYTVCASFVDEAWVFSPYGTILNRAEDAEFPQDVVYKFSVPASERFKVLRLLDEYNLNGFSLFGSDESLMGTLAFRSLDGG